MRLLLEPGAAALAAVRASEDDIAAIRACADRAQAEIAKPELMPALDAELHERIVSASGNPLLEHLHAATSALGAESRSYTTRLPGVLDDTIAEHADIVAAIVAGDEEGARLAMEAHLRRIARSRSPMPRIRTAHARWNGRVRLARIEVNGLLRSSQRSATGRCTHSRGTCRPCSAARPAHPAEDPVAGARRLAPALPGKVVAIGLNYMDHVVESEMGHPPSR